MFNPRYMKSACTRMNMKSMKIFKNSCSIVSCTIPDLGLNSNDIFHFTTDFTRSNMQVN